MCFIAPPDWTFGCLLLPKDTVQLKILRMDVKAAKFNRLIEPGFFVMFRLQWRMGRGGRGNPVMFRRCVASRTGFFLFWTRFCVLSLAVIYRFVLYFSATFTASTLFLFRLAFRRCQRSTCKLQQTLKPMRQSWHGRTQLKCFLKKMREITRIGVLKL